MGLFLNAYYRSVFVVPKKVQLQRYGRITSLAILVLAFSVGTARSYVTHDGSSAYDIRDVSRETFSFDDIMYITEAVSELPITDARAPMSLPSYKSSSTTDNLCTSLLNTRNTNLSKDPVVRTQRPVGKVAALGMLLGARFALAPKEKHDRAGVDKSDVLSGCQIVASVDGSKANHSAKSIAAYRQCMKTKALSQVASAR